MLVPCNYVGEFGDHTVPPGCNVDLQAQNEYVGEILNLQILHNRERLDLQKIGEATIVKESYLYRLNFKGNDT